MVPKLAPRHGAVRLPGGMAPAPRASPGRRWRRSAVRAGRRQQLRYAAAIAGIRASHGQSVFASPFSAQQSSSIALAPAACTRWKPDLRYGRTGTTLAPRGGVVAWRRMPIAIAMRRTAMLPVTLPHGGMLAPQYCASVRARTALPRWWWRGQHRTPALVCSCSPWATAFSRAPLDARATPSRHLSPRCRGVTGLTRRGHDAGGPAREW